MACSPTDVNRESAQNFMLQDAYVHLQVANSQRVAQQQLGPGTVQWNSIIISPIVSETFSPLFEP